MTISLVCSRLVWALSAAFLYLGVANAQIKVTEARIGCLDNATRNEGNLTQVVGSACNGKFSCSFQAPTEKEYRQMGVQAFTKTFCTQAMEIQYQCGTGASKSVTVPGDAWTHGPADLECPAPIASGGGGNSPFPITRSQLDPINGIGYMQTSVTILSSGQLTATTHTWSAKDLEGFHGSVAVVALDGKQTLLWVSASHMYGVDQKACPPFATCHSDRTDNWNDTIPEALLSRTAYIAIKQRYTPTGVTFDDIGNWARGLGNGVAHELGPILQTIGQVANDIGKDVQNAGNGVDNAIKGLTDKHYYPMVVFNEDFVAKFIDELDQKVRIKDRNIYIIGGSTGGALTLRMGHRDSDVWIKKIVAWNPASVWTTYAHDVAKGFALESGFARADEAEDAGKRESYFNQVFGKPTPVTQPNPEEWYRGDRDRYPGNANTQKPFRSEWPCKWDYIGASRLEMQEIYNAEYRRWHWRFGTELLSFSFFNDSWTGPANSASGNRPANYITIHKPTLLVAGDDDDWNEGGVGGSDVHATFSWENRWTQVHTMAPLMHNTPGHTLFVANAGHSIHNEYPNFFGQRIVEFLSAPAPSGALQFVSSSQEPQPEHCTLALPSVPDFPNIPPQFLENPASAVKLKESAQLGGNFSDGKSPGTYGLRLRPDLRAVAQARNPAFAMAHAAARYYLGEADWAAFADLAVTGRNSYESFQRNKPTEAQIESAARQILSSGNMGPQTAIRPIPSIDETKLQNAVRLAQTRAYQVAWALRNPNPSQRSEFRRSSSLGWIAVSGEDDPPHRPVNVPSGVLTLAADGKSSVPAPQYDLAVALPCHSPHPPSCACGSGAPGNVTFQIRYTVASPLSGASSGPSPVGAPYQVGVLPPEPNLTIPPGDDIIIYIHGGPGSRLEEAGDMVEPLQRWGLQKGKRYTVISFDQPSQGYSSMVDPACVVPPHD